MEYEERGIDEEITGYMVALRGLEDYLRTDRVLLGSLREYGLDLNLFDGGSPQANLRWWLEQQLEELALRRAAADGEAIMQIVNHMKTNYKTYRDLSSVEDVIEVMDEIYEEKEQLVTFYYKAINTQRDSEGNYR